VWLQFVGRVIDKHGTRRMVVLGVQKKIKFFFGRVIDKHGTRRLVVLGVQKKKIGRVID